MGITYEIHLGRKVAHIIRDWNTAKEEDDFIPWTEACPFCGRKHIHGGVGGTRAVHCGNGSPQTCVADDGTVLHAHDGYILLDFDKPEGLCKEHAAIGRHFTRDVKTL